MAGTSETCRRTLKRSAYGGRPEVIDRRPERRFLTQRRLGNAEADEKVGVPMSNVLNQFSEFELKVQGQNWLADVSMTEHPP